MWASLGAGQNSADYTCACFMTRNRLLSCGSTGQCRADMFLLDTCMPHVLCSPLGGKVPPFLQSLSLGLLILDIHFNFALANIFKK